MKYVFGKQFYKLIILKIILKLSKYCIIFICLKIKFIDNEHFLFLVSTYLAPINAKSKFQGKYIPPSNTVLIFGKMPYRMYKTFETCAGV